MSHDIIDNRTRELAPEISNFLADSVRAHFAVGYFFLSGFEAIAENIPHLDQLRLLIGNVTNRQTVEQLVEGYLHLETAQRAVRRQRMARAQAPAIRTETASSIQATLELMDQTDEAQSLVLSLADLIAQGKVQVRVYTRGRLHAKAYIHDEKARLHERLPALAKDIGDRSGRRDIALDAYIISATPYDDLYQRYDDGTWDRERFAEKHILFQERGPEYDYMKLLFTGS